MSHRVYEHISIISLPEYLNPKIKIYFTKMLRTATDKYRHTRPCFIHLGAKLTVYHVLLYIWKQRCLKNYPFFFLFTKIYETSMHLLRDIRVQYNDKFVSCSVTLNTPVVFLEYKITN